MAKKIIKISRGGESAAAPAPRPASGPARPVSLSQAMDPTAELKQTQPMKRIVVGGKSPQRTAVASATTARPGARPGVGQPGQQKRKPQKKSGPPLWLIPVGIIGLVILVVIISSSGKRPDPYYQGGPVVEQPRQQRVLTQNNGPRPMRDYMKKHGPSDMAKERAKRMGRKPASSK